MEFSFDRQQNTQDNSDTSGIANERLRKAIERNRQRQKEREEREQREQTQTVRPQAARPQFVRPQFQSPPPPPPPFEQQINQAAAQENIAEEVQAEEVEVEEVIEERRRPTRRSVARPEDTEFVAVKRTTKKVAPTLNYHTTANRKKSKPLDPAIISFLTKCAWIFAGFLVVRLVFAKGGVTDFYSQHKVLVQKQSELKHIKDENMQLVRVIERMHTDAGYQKKLVRDNLGFIASDEYLILFPKE